MMGMHHGRSSLSVGLGMMAVVSMLLTLPLLWLMRDIAESLHEIAEKP